MAAGRVVTVEPDRRIVLTWGYEGDGQAVPAGASTVEITLEPDPDGTRVRLRHTGLPATEPPRAHLAGWRHALATLAYNGSADQLAPVLGERVADWLADHIGMAQRMGGGARLVGRGDPDPCHGVVRFGWSAVGPGEVVLATGPTWPGPTWTGASGG